MKQGDVEFVQVVASMIACPATVALVVLGDERRLSDSQRARAWPPSSRDFAIFGSWQFGALYGCLALLVHFGRTRGLLAGLGWGLLWVAVLLVVDIEAFDLAARAIDWLGL